MVMICYAIGCVILYIICSIIYHYYKNKKGDKMPQGLQVWDSNGNLTFDSTVQTTYVLGAGTTGTGKTGSLYDERLIGYDNQFWVQITSTPKEERFQGWSTPTFSLSNGTLTWTHANITNSGIGGFTKIGDRSFIYGVY